MLKMTRCIRGVAQSGSARALGARRRGFKSRLPDQACGLFVSPGLSGSFLRKLATNPRLPDQLYFVLPLTSRMRLNRTAHRLPKIQPCDRLANRRGREVHLAHRHRQRGVPRDLLDGLRCRAAHREGANRRCAGAREILRDEAQHACKRTRAPTRPLSE